MIASGLLDRALQYAATVNINGASCRLREERTAGLIIATLAPHSEV